MRKRLILTLILASATVSVGAYYELRRPTGATVRFETALVTRGDITATVVSTGTLQAVTTVEVGTQANGRIKELNADFNSVGRIG